MENSGVVIDTSLFIEFLRATNKKETLLYSLSQKNQFYISVVTLYELLMGATNEQKKHDVLLLTDDIIILPFDENVSFKSAEIYHELRKSNQMIEFRDIFIAATCQVYNLPIATLNFKHFQRVKSLNIYQ